MNRISKDRYKKNIILNYVFQILSMLLAFISVRIDLMYLGKTLYGLWMTVASITTIMNLGNLGIGNGLRNELAKAVAKNEDDKINNLISAGIKSLSKVSIFFLVVGSIAIGIALKLNWVDETLIMPLIITLIFFCVNLILGLTSSVAYGFQESWIVTLTTLIIYLIQLIIISLFILLNVSKDLSLYAFVIGGAPTIGYIFEWKKLSKKGLNFHYVSKSTNAYLNSILNLGLKFFVLQACEAILFSTDSIIINAIMGSDYVTDYTLITRLYDAGNSLFSIVLISLWSGVTYAKEKGDFKWIDEQIKSLDKLWCGFSIGVIIVAVLNNWIISIWSGGVAISYSKSLIILFAVSCIAKAWNGIYVNVANGLGKTSLQLVIWVICAVLNIPLSVFLGKYCNMGLFGVKLASALAVFISSIAMPILVTNYLKRLNKYE